MKRDLSMLDPTTLWECLAEEEPQLESLQLGSTDNTEPNPDKVYIPREIIREWGSSDIDPFPSLDGLVAYAKQDQRVWNALQTHIQGPDWLRVLSTFPWALNSETILEMMLKTHFDIVNLALERTAVNGKHVMIQGGKSATAGNIESKISSEPDRATFLAPAKQEDSVFVYCLSELDRQGSKNLHNIIPGEIKLYYKFRRAYLDATNIQKKRNGQQVETPDDYKRKQAEQVFTQIYQYMNERHCSVGYLMTDQELICLRRSPEERLGLHYGVIDISPAIPLSASNGQLNAKLALWYLHHKYAVSSPHLNVFQRTPRPRNWSRLVKNIQRARSWVSQDPPTTRITRSSANGLSGRSLSTNVEEINSDGEQTPSQQVTRSRAKGVRRNY
jgi:hypothetical protein